MEIMQIAKPYFEGLANRELLLPWCHSCGRPHFYPRSACPHCWGEKYEWRAARGDAVVHSVTAVRANPPSAFKPLLPYCIAVVQLEEGVRMLTNIVSDQPSTKVGDRVRVEFAERGGEVLPLFRPVK